MASIVTDDSVSELTLIGYQAPLDQGFALPCFGDPASPDAWWVARSLIPGDHQSQIARFDPFAPIEVINLVPEKQRAAAIGSPWLDVFLLDGEPFVGTPKEILDALGCRFDATMETAPLQALELAIASGHLKTPELVRSARASLAELHGEARAEQWLRQLIIRPQARLELRRRLERAGLDDDQNRVQQITVEASGDGEYHLNVPVQLTEALSKRGQDGAVVETATAVSTSLAVPLGAQRPRRGETIVRVVVEGARRIAPGLIIAASNLKPGDPINTDLLEQAVGRVRLMNRFDKVEGVVVRGIVTLQVQEAEVYVEIRIDGAVQIPAPLVRDAAALKSGTIITDDEIDAALQRVQQLYDRQNIQATCMAEGIRTDAGPALYIRIDEIAMRGATTKDDILIVHRGRNADLVMRLVTSPDWSPYEDRAYVTDRFGGPRFSFAHQYVSRIHVRHDLPVEGLDAYKVVVFLVDDDPELVSSLLGQAYGPFSQVVSHRVLIAPVLPPDRPPELLADRLQPLAPLNAFMLDTSLIRSPFWPRSRRLNRSRDQADYILGAAMLLASGVDQGLRRLEDSEPVPVLAWGRNAHWGEGGLVSECFPDRFLNAGAHGESRFAFNAYEKSFSAPPQRCYGAITFGRADYTRFADLAAAAFRMALGPETLPPLREVLRPETREWMDWMVAPALSVVLDERDQIAAASKQAIITAETPKLELVVAAADKDISVARYTDTDALKALTLSTRRPSLPQEVALPTLQRLVAPGSWASRGLDTPRQGRRIPVDVFMNLGGPDRTPFARQVRLLREGIDPLEPIYAVAPNLDTVEYANVGDPLAQAFIELEMGTARPDSKVPQRAWCPPPTGFTRFVLQATLRSVGVARLQDDEVPSRSLLYLDGDMSTPILLTSRAFAIWVRAAGLPVYDRFRVTPRLLETFPLPAMMERVEIGPNHLGLVMKYRSDHIVSEGDGKMIWHGPSLRLIDSDVGRTSWDTFVLSGYDLADDASDIQILERLVSFNKVARA